MVLLYFEIEICVPNNVIQLAHIHSHTHSHIPKHTHIKNPHTLLFDNLKIPIEIIWLNDAASWPVLGKFRKSSHVIFTQFYPRKHIQTYTDTHTQNILEKSLFPLSQVFQSSNNAFKVFNAFLISFLKNPSKLETAQ